MTQLRIWVLQQGRGASLLLCNPTTMLRVNSAQRDRRIGVAKDVEGRGEGVLKGHYPGRVQCPIQTRPAANRPTGRIARLLRSKVLTPLLDVCTSSRASNECPSVGRGTYSSA